MTGLYFINANDIWATWGMFPPEKKGFFGNLFKAPERKFGLTKNWADQNGTQRALSKVTYNSRELELTFILAATSKEQLLDRYNLFRVFILANPTFNFKCADFDRLFTLKYRAMPSFNKLTSFNREVQGNEMICVELTLSLTDNAPTTYLNASGSVIELTYPEPKPDVPLDLNDFTFALVGDYVIMSGEGIGDDEVSLEGNLIEDNYGLTPKEGFYNELLRLPEAKEAVGRYETRTLELPFYLHASSEGEFYERYYALLGFLLDSGYFTLDINNLNKRFTLLYSNMPTLNQLTLIKGETNIWAEMVITCLDDSPTAEGGLGMFDGHFDVNEDGDLIYTQSDYWDDKLTVQLQTDGENRNLVINVL